MLPAARLPHGRALPEGSAALSRGSLIVRPAGLTDVPDLVALSLQLRAVGRDGLRPARTGHPPSNACLEQRVVDVLGDPACRVMVADDAGTVIGMAMFSIGRIGQLLDRPAVQLTHLVVADGHRHHGVGRSLIAAAVAWAEEIGADDVVASVGTTMREANRFYARLGFAPLVVRRVASVPSLRRRLAQLDRRPGSERRLRRRVIGTRENSVSVAARIVHVDEVESAPVGESV